MASGKPPWSEYNNQMAVMYHVIQNNEPPPFPDHLSSEAKDFLQNCLQFIIKIKKLY